MRNSVLTTALTGLFTLTVTRQAAAGSWGEAWGSMIRGCRVGLMN
jgi:hypothetical protein